MTYVEGEYLQFEKNRDVSFERYISIFIADSR